MIINSITRYLQIFGALAAFWAGWYGGYTHYNVKQLRINLNATNKELQNKDRLIIATAQNVKNITDQSMILKNQRDVIQTKLEKEIKDNADAKNIINARNHITFDLLRRVGALRTANAKLSKSTTTSRGIISADAAVPAYDYVQWAVGLKAHDDICVVAFNNLQKIYNQQMILINGFDK